MLSHLTIYLRLCQYIRYMCCSISKITCGNTTLDNRRADQIVDFSRNINDLFADFNVKTKYLYVSA